MTREEDNLPLQNRFPQSFDSMSVDELEDYISTLKAEIQKTEMQIKKKKDAEESAHNVFKT